MMFNPTRQDIRIMQRVFDETGFRFFAQDADGRQYAFRNEPKKDGGEWIADGSFLVGCADDWKELDETMRLGFISYQDETAYQYTN